LTESVSARFCFGWLCIGRRDGDALKKRGIGKTMDIAESTIEEVLRSEDIESLFQNGAPDNECISEVRGIVNALGKVCACQTVSGHDFSRAVNAAKWARL
jgi:hypothetical protein